MLKYAILGFLNYSPMTGYEIKQRIDRSTTHFWHAELSQIYVTLKALEESGEVVSEVKKQSARPDKRVFQITAMGQEDFQQWLTSPQAELSPKKELLVLKMFFAARMDKDQALAQLQLALDLHQKQLAYYRNEVVESIRASAVEFPMLKEDARMWEATRRFGELYEELYVRWIEEMIESYRGEK
ncbi:MAG TPA: PadR family transcriptional regulator [Longilinea sp.]|nr:PadR family transcriptional regulator [Longilinea sp.]